MQYLGNVVEEGETWCVGLGVLETREGGHSEPISISCSTTLHPHTVTQLVKLRGYIHSLH